MPLASCAVWSHDSLISIIHTDIYIVHKIGGYEYLVFCDLGFWDNFALIYIDLEVKHALFFYDSTQKWTAQDWSECSRSSDPAIYLLIRRNSLGSSVVHVPQKICEMYMRCNIHLNATGARVGQCNSWPQVSQTRIFCSYGLYRPPSVCVDATSHQTLHQ